MRLTEIRIAGFGGQGVILAAAMIGKAACIFQNDFATMTQSFGPEARGGSSSAQVILSDEPVTYPYITQPDILVVMSQEAFTRFSPELKDGGLLIVEQDLVRVSGLQERHPRLQRAGHAPGRGVGQEDGAQRRDGRILRRGHRPARSRAPAQSGGRFRSRRRSSN